MNLPLPNLSLSTSTPLILALETATRSGGVAITRGANVIAQTPESALVTSHALNLLANIDALLKDANITLADIELFAITAGPGSFTGIRTGIATVKAFAQIFDRPTHGVKTLHAVAASEAECGDLVLALMPAGRRELFAQLLRVGEDDVVELSSPQHLAPSRVFDLISHSQENIKFAGDTARSMIDEIREQAMREGIAFVGEGEGGVATRQSLLNESLLNERSAESNSWTVARPPAMTLARAVASLSLKAYRENRTTKASDLQAVYVRPADVKLKTHVEN